MRRFTSCFCLSAFLTLSSAAWAQQIPGSADAGRVQPQIKKPLFDHGMDEQIHVPESESTITIPEEAKDIHFVLRAVRIEGMTAFAPEDMADLYSPRLGKDVTLDIAWFIAGAITERYRNEGYFLSRAYVPAQDIEDGVLVIKVIEGYIGEVELDDEKRDHRLLRNAIAYITAKKPIKSEEIESFLLLINDLPGIHFRAVLSALSETEKAADEAAVKLTLVPKADDQNAAISLDNLGSRFLGPSQATLSWEGSVIPFQNTTVSAMTTIPTKELKYISAAHSIALSPAMSLDVTTSHTNAKPGDTLRLLDVESRSSAAGISLQYKLVRRRLENLSVQVGLDGRNTSSDLAGAELTRDRIRALRVTTNYDVADRWNGYNTAILTLSQGLKIFGSSEAGDLNLSRAEAEPDFFKAEIHLSRTQSIAQDWFVRAALSAQFASGPLYSSEEFGYGGLNFGRAYDSSEITGDHGMASSLEIQYAGWADLTPVSLIPYVFYDIGKVWNEDTGQADAESGSSAGTGVKFSINPNISGHLAAAFPLTRSVANPLYGSQGDDPRLVFQITKGF